MVSALSDIVKPDLCQDCVYKIDGYCNKATWCKNYELIPEKMFYKTKIYTEYNNRFIYVDSKYIIIDENGNPDIDTCHDCVEKIAGNCKDLIKCEVYEGIYYYIRALIRKQGVH
jgi:hypothetical protein